MFKLKFILELGENKTNFVGITVENKKILDIYISKAKYDR